MLHPTRPEPIRLGRQGMRRHGDNRRVARCSARPNGLSRLQTIGARHRNIHQNDVELAGAGQTDPFVAIPRLHHLMALCGQHVAHDQAVDRVIFDHQRQPGRSAPPVLALQGLLRGGFRRGLQDAQGKADPERAAHPRLAFNRQGPPHPRHNPFDNAKPQPGARHPALGWLKRHKILKYPAQIAARDANSGVRDANLGRPLRRQMGQGNADRAAFGEFDRVPHQIEQDLPQLRRIADDAGPVITRGHLHQTVALRQARRGLVVKNLCNQQRQVDRPQTERRLATVQPRDVQDVIDLMQQQLARGFHDPQIFALMWLQIGAVQQVDRPDHPVQRRANLVAHHHQQIRLGLFARQSLIPRPHQGLFRRDLHRQIPQDHPPIDPKRR